MFLFFRDDATGDINGIKLKPLGLCACWTVFGHPDVSYQLNVAGPKFLLQARDNASEKSKLESKKVQQDHWERETYNKQSLILEQRRVQTHMQNVHNCMGNF